jgi:peptidoglycan/LPS O-acetylase OafA/YrhL
VPVFFAISGFVIAYSAEGRTPNGFAIARFSRIYPTFVLCMTLTFAATLLFGAGHFEVKPAQWFANLFIAAPLVGQPYVDTSYWSLVIEVVFYAWVAAFMALGLFPRRIDAIIVVWLAITFANELTIDAPIFEKLFMADDSGFFAVGLLIYAAICIVSLAIVFLATRIKRVPLPATVVLTAGAITYPLYLLHMQLGYVILDAQAPQQHVEAVTCAIVFGAFVLAYAVWRFFERSAHRSTQVKLTELAGRAGFKIAVDPIRRATRPA